jgi:hypothetical protein
VTILKKSGRAVGAPENIETAATKVIKRANFINFHNQLKRHVFSFQTRKRSASIHEQTRQSCNARIQSTLPPLHIATSHGQAAQPRLGTPSFLSFSPQKTAEKQFKIS